MDGWDGKNRTLLKLKGCGTQMPSRGWILDAGVWEFGSLGFEAAVDFVGD